MRSRPEPQKTTCQVRGQRDDPQPQKPHSTVWLSQVGRPLHEFFVHVPRATLLRGEASTLTPGRQSGVDHAARVQAEDEQSGVDHAGRVQAEDEVRVVELRQMRRGLVEGREVDFLPRPLLQPRGRNGLERCRRIALLHTAHALCEQQNVAYRGKLMLTRDAGCLPPPSQTDAHPPLALSCAREACTHVGTLWR